MVLCALPGLTHVYEIFHMHYEGGSVIPSVRPLDEEWASDVLCLVLYVPRKPQDPHGWRDIAF